MFPKNYKTESATIVNKKKGSVISLSKPRSKILIPFEIDLKTTYELIIVASKVSGNGCLFVSIEDNNPVAVLVDGNEEDEYRVVLGKCGGKFFKISRETRGTGCLYVKSVVILSTNKEIDTKSIVFGSRKLMKTRQKKTYYNVGGVICSGKDFPLVSIITPTRDGHDLIESCYKAIKENTIYPNWEWIIGDSNSQDGTSELIKSWQDSRIKLVERKTTEGSFSSINNELASKALGEYLLFLNDDTQPQSFWLCSMMSQIRTADVGVVGAQLLYPNGQVQHAGVAFTAQGPVNIGKAVLGSFQENFSNTNHELQAITGACMLVRKTDFLEVGGFDEGYYFCYEDVDLCLKINKQLNKKIVYASAAKVIHAESVSQKKYPTSGTKQKDGIALFKSRWLNKVDLDFLKLMKEKNFDRLDVSFVVCVSNKEQLATHVVGSLLHSKTKKKIEIVPIFNEGNRYSAAQALNLGTDTAKSNLIVLCHQDVAFFEDWIDNLFERISEIETETNKWGVLGTAGITRKDDTIGVVYSGSGSIQWGSTVRAKKLRVQTVDEHCMVIKKNSGLRFDEKNFDGFHLYGPDICLEAESRGFQNFGILCPLIHNSASASTNTGKSEFMRVLKVLADKWGSKYPKIRTPTSVIDNGKLQTYINFK